MSIPEPISDDDSARIYFDALDLAFEQAKALVTEAYVSSALNRTELAEARIVIRKPRATRMLIGLAITVAIALAIVLRGT